MSAIGLSELAQPLAMSGPQRPAAAGASSRTGRAARPRPLALAPRGVIGDEDDAGCKPADVQQL
jgi:hypothetical protein